MMKRLFCILFVVLAIGCSYNDVNKRVDCSTSDLSAEMATKTDASSCKAIDGKLTITARGGKPPYDFSLNGGIYQTNNEFLNLGLGSYNVLVKDANGCIASTSPIEISAPNSTLDASLTIVNNSQCIGPNGSVTVSGTGGTGPYSYLLGTGGFSTTNVFSNLKDGIYTIIVKDANDCQKMVSAVVPRQNTNISYTSSVKPILDNSCSFPSCHGAGTGSRDWTVFQNVKTNAANIKTRTGNRSMPIGNVTPLTQNQIDLIACWVDDGALNN
jgi:hypothetical protein